MYVTHLRKIVHNDRVWFARNVTLALHIMEVLCYNDWIYVCMAKKKKRDWHYSRNFDIWEMTYLDALLPLSQKT